MDRYSESIDLLYSTNHFFLESVKVLFALPTVILSQRLSAIQSLQLAILNKRFPAYVSWAADEYTGIWEAIARFSGLRKLHVYIAFELIDRKSWDDNQQLLLKPARTFRDIDDMRLTVPVRMCWVTEEQATGRYQIYAYNDDAVFERITFQTS